MKAEVLMVAGSIEDVKRGVKPIGDLASERSTNILQLSHDQPRQNDPQKHADQTQPNTGEYIQPGGHPAAVKH